MNKNPLLSFSKLGLLFLIVAVLFAIIVHTGANHPPLKFANIGEETVDFIKEMAQREYKDACVALSSQGPFKWDNEKDLGNGTALGQWSSELDHDAVVYFRRDKDAEWQEKAQTVLFEVDRIAEELSEMMGKICCASDSSNGRKLPVYLAESEQEYLQVLEILSEGSRCPTNKNGGSVIKIGPLGCKDNGIVLHPDSFKDAQEYEYVLRKEMARYAYLSSVDFNEVIDHQSWFTDGLVEFFAAGVDSLSIVTEEMIDSIEKYIILENTGGQLKGVSPEVGAAFIQFISASQGGDKLTELIQESFKVSLDSAFVVIGLNFQQIKDDWINKIRESIVEEVPIQS